MTGRGNTHSIKFGKNKPGYILCDVCQSSFNPAGMKPEYAVRLHESKAAHKIEAVKKRMTEKGFIKVRGFQQCIKMADESLLEWADIGEAAGAFWAPAWAVAIAERKAIKVGMRSVLIKYVMDNPDLQTEMVVRRAFGEQLTLWLLTVALKIQKSVSTYKELDFWDRSVLQDDEKRKKADEYLEKVRS